LRRGGVKEAPPYKKPGDAPNAKRGKMRTKAKKGPPLTQQELERIKDNLKKRRKGKRQTNLCTERLASYDTPNNPSREIGREYHDQRRASHPLARTGSRPGPKRHERGRILKVEGRLSFSLLASAHLAAI
jgi:hypothetical protein